MLGGLLEIPDIFSCSRHVFAGRKKFRNDKPVGLIRLICKQGTIYRFLNHQLSGKLRYPAKGHFSPVFCLFLVGFILSCNHSDVTPAKSGYPKDVAKILNKTCASSGCHTTKSSLAAGGLNLESWSTLFKGSRGGSPIIPYAPEASYLLYSVNSDSTLGLTLFPTMPLNEPELTSEEYATLWNWIFDGARNADGEERFPAAPNRSKWYIGHEACDEVAIFDAESRQIMRMIDVGVDPVVLEYIRDIKISPNGEDWFVVYFSGNEFISRYSTATDEKIADIPMGFRGWSEMAFSPDGKLAFATSELFSLMQVVDLTKNQAIGPQIVFDFPIRSPMVHPAKKQLYVTEYLDNELIIFDYDDAGNLNNKRYLDIIQDVPPPTIEDIWPFEIFFLPDGSKYFITCVNSSEVRVMDGETDSLLEVISLPEDPARMSYSAKRDRLFVSCTNDLASWPGDLTRRGSIQVINPNTYQVEKTIYAGFQSFAIYADDTNDVLVVSNRNEDLTGPRPHHVSNCEGRNGYITLIDLNTMELIEDFKPEILAAPSTIGGR